MNLKELEIKNIFYKKDGSQNIKIKALTKINKKLLLSEIILNIEGNEIKEVTIPFIYKKNNHTEIIDDKKELFHQKVKMKKFFLEKMQKDIILKVKNQIEDIVFLNKILEMEIKEITNLSKGNYIIKTKEENFESIINLNTVDKTLKIKSLNFPEEFEEYIKMKNIFIKFEDDNFDETIKEKSLNYVSNYNKIYNLKEYRMRFLLGE